MADAANRTTEALTNHRVEQEPAFTDRMLANIEREMDGFQSRGIRWTAKTLTDRGKGSQEKQFGADFVGVLNIRLADYALSKGFLAQSKLIEHAGAMPQRDFRRMQEQCRKMLELVSDAFVFLYTSQGISVVPANAVVAAEPCNPHELYSRSVSRFFEEHFECFIGDQRLSVAHIEALEVLRASVQARSLLYLGLTQVT